MTTKSYSNDLRLRVIDQIKSGMKQKMVSQLFAVSINAVNRWWLRYKKEGSLVSKIRGGSKGKLDPLELEKYVKSNPNQTLEEIGKVFGVSDCAIHKRLKALGFRYKKKTLNIWKQIKKEEKST
ncbi:Transposase [Candidatus Arcanobacter lacustris]|uniref:Transposase n=1 Tax=Candidatus Arcanibacter lacustris TaxID=1607817 RepID=A0A0F5MN95_9RICK|nr:Transposase [Candidatus Arcanobacter lacustris]KKB96283.1 Transposase [Candidatus Arcanobacter lacustris]